VVDSSHVARLSCLRLRRGFDYLAPAAVAESSHRQTHDSVPSKEVATLAALALGPAELIKESPLDFQHLDPRNFLSQLPVDCSQRRWRDPLLR